MDKARRFEDLDKAAMREICCPKCNHSRLKVMRKGLDVWECPNPFCPGNKLAASFVAANTDPLNASRPGSVMNGILKAKGAADAN